MPVNDLRETHQSIAVEHLSDGGEANIFKTLTRQQTVIMDHVANGLTNKEIAQRLKISVKTVEAHRANMMKKIRVSNTAQLLKAAIQGKMLKLR